MTATEKNAHYGLLNDRFDCRAEQLLPFGFRYTHIPEYGMAAFTRPRPGRQVKETIPAAFVMNADEIVWADKIEEVSR